MSEANVKTNTMVSTKWTINEVSNGVLLVTTLFF